MPQGYSEKFVEASAAGDANILALSALLTTTIPNMKTTIETIQQGGLRDKVKIMIGGAPVTQHYANEIGGDGFAADASSAVGAPRQLLQSAAYA